MNNSKKQITAILTSAILLCSLTGCYPTGEYQKNSNSQENLDYQGEMFNINADLPIDVPKSVPIVKVNFKKFDNDKMIDIFLNGETLTEMKNYDNGHVYIQTKDSTLSISNDAGMLRYGIDDKQSRSQLLYLS